MKRILFIITVLGLFVPAFCLAGTAYYVDPTAPAGGIGTFERPWNSIAQVNAKVFSVGDGVYFKVGTTMTMTDRLLINWAGTKSDPVVIGAYYGKGLFGLNGAARPILLGSKTAPVPAGPHQALIEYIGPGNVTVQDLHVKDSYGLGIQLGEKYDADGRRSVNNSVKNCVSQDSGRQGILLARTSYSIIEDCLVDGASQTATLLASGKVGYGGAGIEVRGMGRETSVYNIIRGNTVRRAGESIGIYLGARFTTVEKNVVYDPGQVGIYAANARDGVIRNNIVYWNNPKDSMNHLMIAGHQRKSLIHIDAEGHIANFLKVTGGWEISGNYLAGGATGIWLQCNANKDGIFQQGNKIHDNIIVDCDRNFWIHQAVNGWGGNEIYNNYSFIFTSGLEHVKDPKSPIGVTWNGNHFNTAISTVSGNAGSNAIFDKVALNKTSGWRDLPLGSVSESFFEGVSSKAIGGVANLRVR